MKLLEFMLIIELNIKPEEVNRIIELLKEQFLFFFSLFIDITNKKIYDTISSVYIYERMICMKIGIVSDHRGVYLKDILMEYKVV